MNIKDYAESDLPLTRESLCECWQLSPYALEKQIQTLGHPDILRTIATMRFKWREGQGDPCPRTGRLEWLAKWGLTHRRYVRYRTDNPIPDADMTAAVRAALREIATRFDQPMRAVVRIAKRL